MSHGIVSECNGEGVSRRFDVIIKFDLYLSVFANSNSEESKWMAALFVICYLFPLSVVWGRVGRGWGEGGERVGRGWGEGGERVGRGWGEGGERVGRGWGEGGERVGRGWGRGWGEATESLNHLRHRIFGNTKEHTK